jgi:PAS domain-containing protein
MKGKCLLGGVDLTDRKKAEETIKSANERFEIISSATNDAIFELDFISGKAGIISYDNLNSHDKIYQLRKINYCGGLYILMIAIELLKGLKPVMLEPQIPGQMNRFLRADGTYGNFYERAIIIEDDQGKATFYSRC